MSYGDCCDPMAIGRGFHDFDGELDDDLLIRVCRSLRLPAVPIDACIANGGHCVLAICCRWLALLMAGLDQDMTRRSCSLHTSITSRLEGVS